MACFTAFLPLFMALAMLCSQGFVFLVVACICDRSIPFIRWGSGFRYQSINGLFSPLL